MINDARVLTLTASPSMRGLTLAAGFGALVLLVGSAAYAATRRDAVDPRLVAGISVVVIASVSFALLRMTRATTIVMANDIRLCRGRREIARSTFDRMKVQTEILRDAETGDVPVIVLTFPDGPSIAIGSWGATTTDWPGADSIRLVPPRHALRRNDLYDLTEALGIYAGPRSDRDAT